MSKTVDLRQMSRSDKLRLMEELWLDLSQDGDNVASPEWHGTVLKERERKLTAGEDKLIDWESAKRDLRKKLK
jgi:hypothetical protein